MVIVMLAITSALLMSLTESTFISMRINRSAEQRIKAEYLLKSAFNVAQELFKNDQPPDDPNFDNWMEYEASRAIPAAYLDAQEPNTTVTLLIKSEKGKVPIKALVNGNIPNSQWKRVLTNLFINLGFDTEPRPDISATCRFEQPRHCSSAETVANLIDYLDQDEVNHTEGGSPVQGIESDLPQGERLRNNGQIDALEELLLVPGFTPWRLKQIAQLVSVELPANSRVNANAAKAPVLDALAQLYPGAIGLDGIGSALEACAKNPDPAIGPLRNQTSIVTCLTTVNPAWPAAEISQAMNPLVEYGGSLYRVIARVEYGTSGMAFMGTALYEKQSGSLPPRLKSMFLY